MTKLEELKAVEVSLYAEFQALEKPLDAKRSEWSIAYQAVQKAEQLAEWEQEFKDAKLKEQANKTTE